MTKEELIAMLTTKEVKAALKGSDTTPAELFKEIEIDDDDTPATIAKKFNAQLKEVINHFQGEVQKSKKEAVDEALAPTRASKDKEIRDFAKANPGMSNTEIVGIMDPLYQSGKSLEEAYKIACKSLDIEPTTGKTVGDGEEEKKEEKKQGQKKDTPKKSLKSSEIQESEDTAGEKKETKAKTLAEVIAENANKLNAEIGNPFDEK